MAREARSTTQKGTIGEIVAALAFEKLGWGAVYNARHDIGTDLLLHAKTEGDVDPLLLVGAQVKSGASSFREPAKEGEPGWWFRDSTGKHIATWRDHVLPHLIVLHDPADDACYWVHVCAETIVPTGKGAKVLVPKANRIAEDCREALEEVANTARAGSGWEGSAWSGAAPARHEDGLRYALIAPRLIAPHPNAGIKSPSPVETIALLVQGRLRQYEHFAERDAKAPVLDELQGSADWTLRLAGAITRRLLHGEVDQFSDLLASASDSAARAAAAVAFACALLDDDRADEALTCLESALAGDGEIAAVDLAWLRVQQARLCVEVGRIGEARQAAISVLAVRAAAGEDVTAGAIAGAAATLLLSTSRWDEKDFANAIKLGDTATVWWRWQTTLRGLDALAERQFKEWVRETSVTIGAEDVVGVQFLSASMLANHAADHGGWRNLSSLTGRARLSELDRRAVPEAAAAGLASLVQAGDTKAVQAAVAHLLADGPAAAIAICADGLRLERATRSSAQAELTLLQYGGDVLPQAAANRAARWILSCLRSPKIYAAFVERTTPRYLLDLQLLETLAGVLPSTSRRWQRAVVKRLGALDLVKDQLQARAWCKVIDAIPEAAWTEKSARAAKPAPRAHDHYLQVALLGIAAPHDAGARRSLLSRARTGSIGALGELGDADEIPKGIAATQIRRLAGTMEEKVTEARSGRYGFGVRDLPRALAVLNLWHPELAEWDSLAKLLGEVQVPAEDKRGAIAALNSHSDRIPERGRAKLTPAVLAIAAGEIGEPTLFDDGAGLIPGAIALSLALGAIDSDQDPEPLLDLLQGDFRHRAWAAHIAAKRIEDEGIGLLVTLLEDTHPSVRAAAAAELSRLVAENGCGPVATRALLRAAGEGGTWVPLAIASSLAPIANPSPDAKRLRNELKRHSSARVRRTAKERPAR